MKNAKETTKQDLIAFIQKLDLFIDEPLTIVALGGTALTLLDLKSSTRDLDFIISSKSYRLLLPLFKSLGFKEIAEKRWLTTDGLIIDIYLDDYIVNVQLVKPSKDASVILREFDQITLRALNFYDICITKIDRGDARDFEDIKHILEKTDTKISLLIRKFILTMDISESENPKFKLLEFIKFIKSLGYKITAEDAEKIQQWQKT
ncbi:hypothetical protein HYY69_01220 [Candidatus Woesearchaeota archaeon]|nr:hypothetical protein [Candidatus Woesearchaeota archaeon]